MKDLRNLTRIFTLLVASAGLTACDPGDSEGEPDATPVNPNCPLWYLDADGDHYGDANDPGTRHCEDPGNGRVDDNSDCDDLKDWVNPGETEVCDGVDNDCSAALDEVCPPGCNPVTLTINSSTGERSDYLMCRLGLSWLSARSICMQNGFDLAHINTEQENQALRSYADGQQIGAMHIGATDRDREGDWYWIGDSPTVQFWSGTWTNAYVGTPASPTPAANEIGTGEAVGGLYSNWVASVDPNNYPTADGLGEDVGVLMPGGGWWDVHINTVTSYVCERF